MSRRARVLTVGASFAAAALCIAAAVWAFTSGAPFFLHPVYEGDMQQHVARGATWLAIALIALAVAGVVVTTCFARSCQCKPQEPTKAEPQHDRAVRWALLAIVLIGIGLRSADIMQGLWYDEIVGVQFALQPIGAILGSLFDPANHILHTLLVSFCLSALADHIGAIEPVVRLPALAFSVATIPLAFGFVRAATRHTAAGLFAAVLVAGLPVFVLEGSNARAYSMMMFFSMASTWALIRAMDRDCPSQWLMYVTVTALGVWAHMVTAFLPVGHAVWITGAVIVGGSARRGVHLRAMTAIALAGLVAVTLYAPALPDLFRNMTEAKTFVAQSEQQPRIFGIEGWDLLLQLGGAWRWWAALPGMALLIVGVTTLIRMRNHTSAGAREAVTLALLGLPLFVAFVALTGLWFYARFALFALPGAVVLMAIGIVHVWQRSRVFGLIAITVLAATACGDILSRPARQPLRGAVEYVVGATMAEEPVAAVGLRHQVIRLYWPAERSLMFLSYDAEDFDAAITDTDPAFIIVYYPHLLTLHGSDTVLDVAGYDVVWQEPGWIDHGRGEVRVYGRVD